VAVPRHRTVGVLPDDPETKYDSRTANVTTQPDQIRMSGRCYYRAFSLCSGQGCCLEVALASPTLLASARSWRAGLLRGNYLT
jgi:hypothetical protein